MNKITNEFFQKFIKYGTGELPISKDSITSRKELIHSCLKAIEEDLPIELQGKANLEQLSSELGEVSVVIQAFGIRNFGLYPTTELRAKETAKMRFENVHMDYGIFTSFEKSISQLSHLISICRNLSEKASKRSLPMQLCVGKVNLKMPSQIQKQLIDFIQKSLEELKLKEKRSILTRKELGLSNFIHIVAANVSRYIQRAFLGYPSANGRPSKNELLISSFVLMAAGYLPTPSEYSKKPVIKDYRYTIDKQHLELTGLTRKIRKPRPQPYEVVLLKKVKHLMSGTRGFSIRLFNVLWN